MVTEMAFHGETLNGVWSRATRLWIAMPTNCEIEKGFSCGVVNTRLSRNLLNFLGIRGDPQEMREVRISVLGDEKWEEVGVPAEDRSEETEGRTAKIFIGVDGKKVVFTVKSTGDGDNGYTRDLSFERDLGHGMKLTEHISKKGPNLEAFYEIAWLANLKAKKVDRWLLCRACPAQINGLPRTEV